MKSLKAADFRAAERCRATLLTVLFFAYAVPGTLPAQSKSGEMDQQVERLHREAKAAEAAGDLPRAAEQYEALLRIVPRLGAAYNNLGSLYLRQHEYQKAVDVLEKGLKIDPAMPSAAALLGIARYEMGNYTAARAPLEAALRANPKDDNAELYLVNDLVQLDQLESAVVHLQQMSRRQPGNQEVWYLLGKVYMKLSENALARLNAIDPNSVLVHEVSGEIMESMSNYDGALIEYKKAVEMAPDKPGTHSRLANAYWALKMWDPATKEFEAELANNPANCEAHWKIGNMRIEQHMEPEAALAEIDRAIAACPNLARARLDRGRVYLKINRYEEAMRDLLVAEQADPSDPSIHFLLAQAYRGLGRSKDAQTEMQLFSKLEEGNRAKTAERARQLLEDKSKATPQP